MPTNHRAALANIRRFDQLIAYLRDEMGWPIERDSFEDVDDLFYEFTAEELGLDSKTAARIQEIKRLRPLSTRQPWGIFFVKFEPKRLPVVALRRILGQVALKKRSSANSAERAAWAADDLLFVSNYGEGDERQISFAHFARARNDRDLPTLQVLGWDSRDTPLHLDDVAHELTTNLAWPDDDTDTEEWRAQWRAAFPLRHREVITTAKDLSIHLAGLARNICDRIKTLLEIETEKGPLTQLMRAFQGALIHDLKPDGFADMYAQTIAYGLLSARIADPQKKTVDDFAAHMRTNPFLRELMETFLKIGGRRGKAGGPGIDFDELGISEVVALLDAANMEAVVRDFGDRNPQEDPVIRFYEGFLGEYNKQLKSKRGVFYTPRPVVSYIVRSVHELLQTEFGLVDGLADTTTWAEMMKRHENLKIPEGTSPDQDFVQILDPATGTGTFLVEVIDLIHQTLVAKWKAQGHGGKKIDELWNEYVPKHLLTRLHGYELLMAPYAIAHLKIGLKLYETGYRFDSEERARVYLTNALEPEGEEKSKWSFKEWIPALAHETAAVDEIKRLQRFTVVIGNPPYSAISSNLSPLLRRVVDPYRYVNGEKIRERSMLQFEKNIQDDYVKFLALSQSTLRDAGWGISGLITNHSYLDGPTLRGVRWNLLSSFHRSWFLDLHGNSNKGEEPPAGKGMANENVFDIKQGVAVSVLLKSPVSTTDADIKLCGLWGARSEKYEVLATQTVLTTEFDSIQPKAPYFYLVPPDGSEGAAEWDSWPMIPDVFTKRSTGTETGFDDLLVGFTRSELKARLVRFCDPSASKGELATEFSFSEGHAAELFARCRELRTISDNEVKLFQLRAYDYRFAALRKELLKTNSFNVMLDLSGQSPGLVTTRQTKENFAAFAVKSFCGHKVTSSYDRSYVFPLFTSVADSFMPAKVPCISRQALAHFHSLGGFKEVGADDIRLAEDIFNYALAVMNASAYAEMFRSQLKRDFPRLPLTGNLELFRALARLGGELTALHLMESPRLDQPMTEFIGHRDTEVEKITYSNDTVWIDKAQTTGFRGVPENVWNFHIGGYQVCQKWLKDRKGRTLSADDLAHYQKIVVALSETIRLMKEIDEVIEQHGGWPNAFQTGEARAHTAKVTPFRPRTVEPKPAERYVTCVPLLPLKAAAGLFSDPQQSPQVGWEDGAEWVAVESWHRLRPGMFVAQVAGRSMEPAIPDGAWCLFRAPVEGARQGRTVLVELRDTADPETGQRYTVKRYESEKAADGDWWRHERITLKPVNPEFAPIVLTGLAGDEIDVVAELVEVLTGERS
jgi:hypothetical protein